MKRILISIVSAAILSGCASTSNAPPPDGSAPDSSIKTVVAKDRTRLVLKRSNDTLYLGAPATVKLDGKEIANLWRSESAVEDVPPGRHRLEVYAVTSTGNFAIDVDLPAGKSAAFEVSPRGEDFMASIILGPLDLVRQAVVQNSGPFKIVAMRPTP